MELRITGYAGIPMAKAVYRGKRITRTAGCDYQFDSLTEVGNVVITGHGEENVYFQFRDDAGDWLDGYVKCL